MAPCPSTARPSPSPVAAAEMSLVALIALGAMFLAFSNGANDNFKGFATVWGSRSLSYRQALVLATLATAAGSLASVIIAHGLVEQFSGKGLIAASVAADPAFVSAVALGAAATVMTATRVGMPVSTTHALIGGLVGAGLGASSDGIAIGALGTGFVAPLLFSPVAAALLGAAVYSILPLYRPSADCACVTSSEPVQLVAGGHALRSGIAASRLVVAPAADCDRLIAAPVRFSIGALRDRLHILSAASICFARGVNDTPKMVALLVSARLAGVGPSAALVALLMGAGGLLLGRRVAETMSLRLNHMDERQGVSANLITALLVLVASRFGLPVSTTHVSVGSIAGVGLGAGTLDLAALRSVLLSWLATLPCAAAVSWAIAVYLV